MKESFTFCHALFNAYHFLSFLPFAAVFLAAGFLVSAFVFPLARGFAAALALVLAAGRTTRLGGGILLVAYSVLAVCFYLSGAR